MSSSVSIVRLAEAMSELGQTYRIERDRASWTRLVGLQNTAFFAPDGTLTHWSSNHGTDVQFNIAPGRMPA